MLHKHGQCVLPHITIVMCGLYELDGVVVRITGNITTAQGFQKTNERKYTMYFILLLTYENILHLELSTYIISVLLLQCAEMGTFLVYF